jgi:hypothetical protein
MSHFRTTFAARPGVVLQEIVEAGPGAGIDVPAIVALRMWGSGHGMAISAPTWTLILA